MKKIGTSYFNYPQSRNFVDLDFQKYAFVEVKDVFRKLTNITFFFTKKIYSPLQFLFFEKGDKHISAYHFFNSVSLIDKPWIVTFETYIPRLGTAPKFVYKYAIERLTHTSCKKMIAISECTADLQLKYMEENCPKLAPVIKNKMFTLHPPQKLLIEEFKVKKIDDKIIFTLVGADFFRKGGKEILLAFDKLILKRYPIHLNIVSSLSFGDYASRATKEDYDEAVAIIRKNGEHITHFLNLPNNKVLELLIQSHIGLLPTYADTYGYSVLEAQAAGCPVISTNVRALPEINNNECGWIINLPLDENKNAKLASAKDRALVSNIIFENLFSIVEDICTNPDIISQKGEQAWRRVKYNHDPAKNARILERIYDEALTN